MLKYSGDGTLSSVDHTDQHILEQYIGRLAEDFEFFCQELWVAVGLPDLAQHQREFARWLQHGPRRRGIRAFRGASKTWVTLAYCIWRLFKDPNDRVMVVSKSEKHARDSLYMVRKWIGQVKWLQHLSPDKRAGHRDSSTKFDVGPSEVDRTPSFVAASITGQIQGSRSNCIIADDCETPENTMTLEQRDRLRERVKEFDNILIPGGDIIFLGTPGHMESLYTKLADSGFTFKAWPVRLPITEELIPDLADELQDRLDKGESPGSPVWPERFHTEELIEREASEGRSTFGMQYMMLTHLGDGLQYPLILRDFIVFPVQRDKAPLTIAWGTTNDRGGSTRCEDIISLGFGTDGFYSPIMYDKDWDTYSGTKMWIDPSGRGIDKTAYAIVSHLNGNLFVKAVGGFDGGYSTEVLEGLAYQARQHGAREIFVEDNFGQGMFRQLFEPVLQRHFVERGSEEHPDGWGATIEGVRAVGQKELRIITALEPIMNQKRLILHPDVAANEELQRQLTRITRERNCLRHDDEVESLAMCVKQWQEIMNSDPERGASEKRQRWIDEKVNEHYAAMGLVQKQKNRWFQHH